MGHVSQTSTPSTTSRSGCVGCGGRCAWCNATKPEGRQDAELGVQDGDAGTWKFLCAPNGILVRIKKDETKAMTLLVVPFSSEVELTLGLPKQLKGKH